MWHKAIWKGHPMRLELTRIGLLGELANHYTTWGALYNSFFSVASFNTHRHTDTHTFSGGTYDVMVIVGGYGHSDPSSNPGWSCLC